MFIYFTVKRVYKSDCINVVRKNDLIYCSCQTVVGYFETIDEREVITFINVREVLFRPHITYVRRCSNGRDAQKVIFTERIENEQRSASNTPNVSNLLIHPLAETESESDDSSQEPTTSSDSLVPIIRVAAFVSENVHELNENRILECFKNAIVRDLSERELGTITTASLVSDVNLREQLSKASSSQVNNDYVQEFDLSEFLTTKLATQNEANRTVFD